VPALEQALLHPALLQDLHLVMLAGARDARVDLLHVGARALQVLHETQPTVQQRTRHVGEFIRHTRIQQQLVEIGRIQRARGLALIDQRVKRCHRRARIAKGRAA